MAISSKHKIFIVEDNPLVRESYVMLIDLEPNMEICGEAETGAEALDKLNHEADLVLIDIMLPDFSGIELVTRLQESHPDTPTLVISAHDKEIYKKQALEAGANGYIDKKDAASELVKAIRHLLDGNEHYR